MRIEQKLAETRPYPREEAQALERLLRAELVMGDELPADPTSNFAVETPRAESGGDIALRDMLTDARVTLEQVRDALGVSYEPHQSLHERTLEAARGLSSARGDSGLIADSQRATLIGHLMLLVSAGRRGDVDKQRIEAAYRFLNESGLNRRYRLSADAPADTMAPESTVPSAAADDGFRDGIAWRLHANGLYGILSEITGTGALSRHGDVDLSDRVALAIASHEQMAAEPPATRPSPTTAAAAPGNSLLMHIGWLHDCLREAGHCIDGGRCHHACGETGKCFRQDGCVPLTGSGLTDDWQLPPVTDERRLDVAAQVGAGIFSAGTKWSTVIAAAQRHHLYMQSPEMEALRLAGARPLTEQLDVSQPGAAISAAGQNADSTLRELHARARVQGVDHWIENARLAIAQERAIQVEGGAIHLLRQARDELGLVEWENDPPSRVSNLLSNIDALLPGRPASA